MHPAYPWRRPAAGERHPTDSRRVAFARRPPLGTPGDMTGAVLILIIIAVAALVFVAGLTPFLFIPLAVVILAVLIVPTIGGISGRMTKPDPEEPRAHRPGTGEASYDPSGGPQH
jgi:hypothetical protein